MPSLAWRCWQTASIPTQPWNAAGTRPRQRSSRASALIIGANAAGSLTFVLIGYSMALGALLSGVSAFWSLPTAFLSGTAAAGGIALINSFGNLGGFVGPYIIGLSKQYLGSQSVGLYVVAGFLIGAAALIVGVFKRNTGATRSSVPGRDIDAALGTGMPASARFPPERHLGVKFSATPLMQ